MLKEDSKTQQREKMEFRASEQERKALKAISAKFGYKVSEYIRRKLFHENKGLAAEEKFVSPHQDKHDLIVISLLHKIFYVAMELVKYAPGMDSGAVQKIDTKALAYARQEQLRYGYKYIKSENNEIAK
jgi:hypothetical protein